MLSVKNMNDNYDYVKCVNKIDELTLYVVMIE